MQTNEKYISVEFPNGDIYHIPASIIANERTLYYSGVDGFEKDSKEWQDEYDHSMEDYELLDWVKNNINWSDIKEHALKQERVSIDYQDQFLNSKITCITPFSNTKQK